MERLPVVNPNHEYNKKLDKIEILLYYWIHMIKVDIVHIFIFILCFFYVNFKETEWVKKLIDAEGDKNKRIKFCHLRGFTSKRRRTKQIFIQ